MNLVIDSGLPKLDPAELKKYHALTPQAPSHDVQPAVIILSIIYSMDFMTSRITKCPKHPVSLFQDPLCKCNM
jgi:hypothetical protein